MSKQRAFVKYTKSGKIVPGSMIVTSGSYPNGPALWVEAVTDLCCDDPAFTSTTNTKAFIRYTKSGKIVPGSLIISNSYPNSTGAIWREVSMNLCCKLFSNTIYWGEDSGTACAQTIPIVVTGDGTTFCNSNNFTGPAIAAIGTGGAFFSYGGQIKTVNVTSGSPIATFNGGCDPCPSIYSFSVKRNNTGSCASSPVTTIYSDSSVLGPGVSVYNDAGLTSPIAEFTHICDCINSIEYTVTAGNTLGSGVPVTCI